MQPEEVEDETEEVEGMGKGDVVVEGDLAHLPAQLPAAKINALRICEKCG